MVDFNLQFVLAQWVKKHPNADREDPFRHEGTAHSQRVGPDESQHVVPDDSQRVQDVKESCCPMILARVRKLRGWAG